ncbi:MAG: hypothetical protein ACTSSP_07510 [Candidatus Asgardarchaeia archaeon]
MKKDPGIAALIATIGGIFGIFDLGHFYAGKINKGVLYLILGIIFDWGGLLLTLTIIGAIIGIPMLIVAFILWILQIYDAYKEAGG